MKDVRHLPSFSDLREWFSVSSDLAVVIVCAILFFLYWFVGFPEIILQTQSIFTWLYLSLWLALSGVVAMIYQHHMTHRWKPKTDVEKAEQEVSKTRPI
jgi:uncharacterized membrane protein